MRLIAIGAALGILLAACASGDGLPSSSDRPPDLVVTAGSEEITIAPHSYCWSRRTGTETLSVCADGVPVEPLPRLTLASGDDLAARFPLAWQIEARFGAAAGSCEGAMLVEVDSGGSPIAVPVPAGSFRVELFGRGQEGDAGWAFELVNESGGETPPRTVQLNWFPSGSDLEVQAPFSALFGNIPSEPSRVSADVLVIAGDGSAETFELDEPASNACWEGVVAMDADPTFTLGVTQLGPPPYEVVVTAFFDDVVLTSDPLRWPDDFPTDSNESRRAAVTLGN